MSGIFDISEHESTVPSLIPTGRYHGKYKLFDNDVEFFSYNIIVDVTNKLLDTWK